ncbi:Uncharacterised protein [Actinomyces naeslundii]|uniref:hypothetical protein n=1 Tax=Actinomyces naeslundii TaxID=1655 RepID=UPI001A50FE79|nr:hypothetical protein [Actinomyces naeslundii]VTX61718.1 Uncharacterised protein [Actinomyces naeslundii]
MSQQAVWHPHRTSTAPAHRRHRPSRLLLAAALLSLPLSACTGQLTSAPIQTTQEVTVKTTALSAEQVTSMEVDANTGPDVDFTTLPAHNSTITVLINWEKKYRKPVGTTLVSRNRSDGALKWAVTITPPGASLNALENADAPQHNVSDLMTSHTSGEIVVSPNGRRISLILTPHHGQLEERLAEQESYVVVLDATSGAVVRTEELNGVILGQGLTNGSLAVETANAYFPGGTGEGQVHVFGLDDPSAPTSSFATDQWLAGAGADSLLLSPQPPYPTSDSGASTVTQVDTSGKVRATIKGVEAVHPGGWVTQVSDPAAVNASANHAATGKKEKPASLDAALQGLTRKVVNVSTGSSVDVTGTIVEDRGVPTGPGLVVSRTSTEASGETTSTPVFWLSADDDGHPHTENLEQFTSK